MKNAITKLANALKRKPPHAPTSREKYETWLRDHTPPLHARRAVLKLVYTDMCGKSWYLPADNVPCTEERATALNDATTNVDYVLTKAEHTTRRARTKALAMQAMQYAGDADKVRATLRQLINEVNDTEFRMSEMASNELYIELAIVMFLIEGENPYIINPLLQIEKRQAVSDDPDLRAFFLQTLYTSLGVSLKNAELNFLDSMDQASRAQARARLKRHSQK